MNHAIKVKIKITQKTTIAIKTLIQTGMTTKIIKIFISVKMVIHHHEVLLIHDVCKKLCCLWWGDRQIEIKIDPKEHDGGCKEKQLKNQDAAITRKCV